MESDSKVHDGGERGEFFQGGRKTKYNSAFPEPDDQKMRRSLDISFFLVRVKKSV